MAARPEDIYIRHQIQLAQYSVDQIRQMVSILEAAHKRAATVLLNEDISVYTAARQQRLLKRIDQLLLEAYKRIGADIQKQRKQLSKVESAFNSTALQALTPFEETVLRVSPSSVAAAAAATPYQGAKMADWFFDLSARERKAVTSTIRSGFVLGSTNAEMAAELRPVFNQSQNQLATIVRSGIQHMANTARQMTFEANDDIVEYQIWSSVLDSRTTTHICAPRDTLRFTLDGEPIGHSLEWLEGPGNAHWNCRSMSVPKIKGVAAGGQKGAFDYNQETTSRARGTVRYDPDTRSVVGKGVRNPGAQRRGKGTQVEATEGYEKWFRRQPAWFQDSVLGQTKGQLFRRGNLRLRKFSEADGQPLTLKELEQQNPTAWARAGLND